MATATDPDVQTDGEAPADEPPPPTLEERLAALEAELVQARRNLAEQADDRERLRESRVKVKRLEGRMLMAKEAASAAKKAYETAMADHLDLEDELDSGQARLPLGEPEGASVEAPAEDDAWRDNKLEVLIGADGGPLREGILQALAENDPPLLTMGDVADWSRAGKYLTDVKGIGEAKAEAIQAVIDHFWDQRATDEPFDAPVDVNAELEAGVREAEAAPDAWRFATIGTLGLSEDTVDLLDQHVIATAGELVALVQLGAAWMGADALADVEAALTRFRNRRSNAEIEDFDVARGGEPWATEEPKGKRTRKAKAS